MDRTFALQQYGPEVQAAIDKIIALTTATTEVDGLLSAEDKAKLDALGILYDTAAGWAARADFVPGVGNIVVYADHATKVVESQTVNIPGLKVGDGTAVVGALPFVGDEIVAALLEHTSNTTIHVTAQDKTAWGAKYDKPGTGIPKTDLEAGVQTSLGKADNAAPQATTYTKTEVDAAVGAINAKIPSQASSENQLADKAFVNSSIFTETATYRGSFNLVSDLGLTIAATQAQIATALAGAISTADNNDYCFVQVPTADATPTEIARVDRYKYNGTAWSYEWSLNNSSFTAAQWAALNSGITSGLVTKLSALPTNADLQAALGLKADKSEMGVSVSGDKTTITLKSGTSAEVINQHQDISGKQDVIVDLSTIRSNAAAGKAASDALGGKTASDILNEAAAQAPKTEQKADQEIVFRKPNVTWDARAAFLKKLKGKTLAWNQLLNPSRFENTVTRGGITFTNNGDGTITVNGTFEEGGNAYILLDASFDLNVRKGHKIYLPGSIGNVVVSSWNSIDGSHVGIFTVPSSADISANVVVTITTPGTYNNVKVYPGFIDLTLLFGAGNEPTTVAEFEAMFQLPYYDYNPGELISNDAKALETVGFNQWDEEWESGSISAIGENVESAIQFRSKNYISVFPNTNYYVKTGGSSEPTVARVCYYDANKQFVSVDYPSKNQVFTTPENAYYMRFVENTTTYNNDICINLSDASRNGTYEPYRKSVLLLNLDSFKVKDGQGNITTITGGLKSAGTVKDEIVGNKYIKKVGSVDLGSLEWLESGSNGGFRALVSGIKQTENTIVGVCSHYAPSTQTNGSTIYYGTEDKVFVTNSGYIGGSGNFAFRDTSFAGYTPAQVPAALSGVMLYYELATYEEYELVEPIVGEYMVDKDGTERAITPLHTSDSPSAPLCADVQYGITPADSAVDAANMLKRWEYIQAQIDEMNNA